MRTVDVDNAEERRRQILAAALACFRAKGFAGASIADICRQASMSPGHLYHYFSSKEDIVAAVVAQDREASRTALAAFKHQPDLVAAIIGALDAVGDLGEYQVDGGLALEIYAEASRHDAIRAAVSENQELVHSELTQLIKAGQRAGTVDPDLDPGAAADLITVIFEGLTIQGIGLSDKRARALARHLPMLIQRIMKPGQEPKGSVRTLRTQRNRKDRP